MKRSFTGRTRSPSENGLRLNGGDRREAAANRRKSGCAASASRGTTLVELSIASGLLAVVMICMYWIMVAGSRYVRVTNATIDLQETSLAAMAHLTEEMDESDGDCFFSDPHVGIIFASPRDADGHLQFDSAGNLQWLKLISFYLDVENGIPVLVRKEKMLAKPSPIITPPTITDTIADFKEARIPYRIVARHVLDITASPGNPSDITVVAGFMDGEKKYELTLTTRALMKN